MRENLLPALPLARAASVRDNACMEENPYRSPVAPTGDAAKGALLRPPWSAVRVVVALPLLVVSAFLVYGALHNLSFLNQHGLWTGPGLPALVALVTMLAGGLGTAIWATGILRRSRTLAWTGGILFLSSTVCWMGFLVIIMR